MSFNATTSNFSDFIRGLPAATEADLAAGNSMPIVSASEVKKMGGENVAKAAPGRVEADISIFAKSGNIVHFLVENGSKIETWKVQGNELNVNLITGDFTATHTLLSAAAKIPIDLRRVGAKLVYRKSLTHICTAVYKVGAITDSYWLAESSWDVLPDNETAMMYKGDVVSDLNLTSLKKCKTIGSYAISSTSVQSITDLPDSSIANSCTLEVYPMNAQLVLQVLTTSLLKRWVRSVNITNETLGADWLQISTDVVYHGNVVSDLGYTSLLSCKQQGVYFATSTELSYITDLPNGITGSFVLSVAKANGNFNLQVLETLDFRTFKRYATHLPDRTDHSEWVETSALSTGVAKTRWAALGDSITEGYYSANGELKGITQNNYPFYVAKINGYDVVNLGAGGSGYVHNGTVPPKTKNAVGMVNDVDFSNYDLVTFAWGVNDWHYSCNIGSMQTSTLNDGTMVGNMRYCIEKVLTDNPSAKIVVILPHNSSKYGGDFSTNWGLGSSLPTSGTLQNVIDREIEVCEYYGIQYIDNTKNGIINRKNIQSLLPDGLHPAIDGYLQIAKYLAKQIQFA